MPPLSLAIAIAAGALGGGAVVWLLMTISRQSQEIAELKRSQQNGPAWAANMKADHRAELLNVAGLVKLAARDNLDALVRVDPGLADDVIREIAPHLFLKDGIK